MPPLGQASQEVGNIYAPSLQQIQAQVPAIQQLYGSLLQGLQAQNTNQVNNVVQSAQQRGVYRTGLNADAGAALGQTLAQQTGQLGSQQAQDIAGIQGQLGKARVEQGQAAYDLANSLQAQNLETQSNQQKLQQIDRNAQVTDVRKQAQAAIAAQKAAAAFDLSTVSADQLTRQLRLGLNSVKGKDGHVSPENLAKAYNTWMAAGLTPESFWKNFQGNWNPKQGNYGDQFHYFVQKGA